MCSTNINVTSPQVIANLLDAYGLAPLKKFGQNFLIDQNIVQKIAEQAVPEGARVLEIGTGLGALTGALANRAEQVLSVEIDYGLIKTHEEIFAGRENITVLQGDILKMDINAVCQDYFGGQPFYVAGNLPYYITSKIIMHILESGAPVLASTVMVQKEVAERLTSQPGDSEYSGFTASCQYFATAEHLFDVPRSCFYPSPDVDSAIVRFTPEDAPDVDRKSYTRLVRAAFAMRRKTLQNNLRTIAPADRVKHAIEQLGVSPTVRAQELAPTQFAQLVQLLDDAIVKK